ncbi:hypothetical protein GCM10027273_22040 [Nocardioides pakistanensis]
MERGRSTAVAIAARVTGSAWVARKRSTRSALVAAGTCPTVQTVAADRRERRTERSGMPRFVRLLTKVPPSGFLQNA